MSIFGVRKHKHKTGEDELTLRTNDLQKKVWSLENLKERLSDFKKETIQQRSFMLNSLNSLHDKNKEIATKQHLNTNKVERKKYYITISAEKKGALTRGDMLSFGNGGRSYSTGYVMIKSGHTIGIGMVSERSSGDVRAQILIDNGLFQGNDIVLKEGIQSNYKIFDTPFNANAGSVISVVVTTNDTTVNTVVSILIELDD